MERHPDPSPALPPAAGQNSSRSRARYQTLLAGCGMALLAIVVCGGILLSTTGDLLSRIRAFFFPPPAGERTLYRVINEKENAAFHLGADCQFLSTSGSAFRSAGDLNGGDGYTAEIPSEEVLALASQSLGEMRFVVERGQVHLESGAPAQTSLIGSDRVSLHLLLDTPTPNGTAAESLEGAVVGNVFQGTFTHHEQLSDVVNGQGVEASKDLRADFSCPIVWE